MLSQAGEQGVDRAGDAQAGDFDQALDQVIPVTLVLESTQDANLQKTLAQLDGQLSK